MPSDAPRSLADVRAGVQGKWRSLCVELRPSEDMSGSGAVEPSFVLWGHRSCLRLRQVDVRNWIY